MTSTSTTPDTSTATTAAIAAACRQLGLDLPEPVNLAGVRDRMKAGHPALHERPRRLLGHATLMLDTVLWVGGSASETGREGLADVLLLLQRAQALGPDGPGYVVRPDGTTLCALCGNTAGREIGAAEREGWLDGHRDICTAPTYRA
ncbi:hypothetical protein OG618_37805 (plasmid) [Kitasatospora sp. NBC_01246]|uniref:hypothetical protein n=1 Tax=Kitasatospora sp. NBC_01246 TaxID=2903570 RepID=UPI002E30D1F5|nr:hypothetical protein [Kitasatospora sp. NBC_01246]